MKFTCAARSVLRDVVLVRTQLEDEIDSTQWRLQWLLVIVLLRAVGHVLIKVDGKSDTRVKTIADVFFMHWKKDDEHHIFSKFIELERNSIIKEYSTQMTDGPVPVTVNLQSANGSYCVQNFLIDENIYRPIDGGYYDGEDGRTLIDIAINWWNAQLDEIDRQVQLLIIKADS